MAGREDRELLFVPVYFLSNMFSLPVGISQNKNPSSCGCQHKLQSQECCQCTESILLSLYRVQNNVSAQSPKCCHNTEFRLVSEYRVNIVVCVQIPDCCLCTEINFLSDKQRLPNSCLSSKLNLFNVHFTINIVKGSPKNDLTVVLSNEKVIYFSL